jgi:hypothetical protein
MSHLWDDPKHYLQRCLLCDLRKRIVKYCGDGTSGYRLVWEYRKGKGRWARLKPGAHVPSCLKEVKS